MCHHHPASMRCHCDVGGDHIRISGDERLPLLLPTHLDQYGTMKVKSHRNRTLEPPPGGARCRSASSGSHDAPCRRRLRRILNRLSWLTAVVGLGRFCYLLARGEYHAWAVPLLLAASVCKLLATSAPPSYEYEHQSHERYPGYRPRATVWSTAGHRLRRTSVVRSVASLGASLKRRFDNDRHSNSVVLSILVVAMPCVAYFVSKAAPLFAPLFHSADSRDGDAHGRLLHEGLHHEPGGFDHERMADYLGRLGAAGLTFLLVPVSKSSSLLGALGWSEVHAIRMHICAGCVVLFGGTAHGLYYAYIWVVRQGASYGDVFPSEECWGGLRAREYDKACHSRLVNFLGVVTGLALLALGLTSLHRVRRRFYRLFYSVHIIVSVILLFGLVMHYNKMILYVAPSLLYYLGSNVPVHVESLIKWRRSRRGGGVEVTRAVCVPESGGCVELTLRTRERDEEREAVAVADEDRTEHDLAALRDVVGKYVRLHVPELSLQAHPFTVFADPRDPRGSLRLLFRPCGPFTTALSRRFEELASMPEPTPSETEHHRSTFSGSGDEKRRPTVLANGLRSATADMLERATAHDRVLIFAGGVGIATYVSLVHALRLRARLAAARRAPSSSGKADAEEDGGGRRDDVEMGVPIDDNGAPPAARRRRRVDVHWMCRDEGLVRHALREYFAPFPDDDRCASSDGDRPPLSIRLVVHHTSPRSMSSPSDDVEADGRDGEATTTWTPGRRRRRDGEGDDDDDGVVGRRRPPFASPSSAYEGNQPALSRNLIPSLALASIAFGGLWIVNYCYDEVQDKHAVETRNVAVAGAVALALAVSMFANAALAAADGCRARRFAYSKLDLSGSDRYGDDDGDVEFDRVANGGVARGSFSVDGGDDAATDDTAADTDSDGSASNFGPRPDARPPSPASPERGGVARDDDGDAVLRIAHSRGRPDLAAIVREALTTEGGGEDAFADDETLGGDGGGADVGVFTCGPTAMCDAVRDAVRREEGARGPCGPCRASGRMPVALYPEVFEL